MYFFTQVLINTDGAMGGRSTGDFATLDLAEQAFHQSMVSTIGKPEYKKAIMFVYDEDGVIKFRRVWERTE